MVAGMVATGWLVALMGISFMCSFSSGFASDVAAAGLPSSKGILHFFSIVFQVISIILVMNLIFNNH